MTQEEIRACLKFCKDTFNYFRCHGYSYRRKHLASCLEKAQDTEDEAAEKKILAIIQREKDRSYWKRLNRAIRKKRGGSVGTVEVEDKDGDITLYDDQPAVENEIWDEVH